MIGSITIITLLMVCNNAIANHKDCIVNELYSLYVNDDDNVEISEVRNEMLFEIVESDRLDCLCQIMQADSIFQEKVLTELKSPVNDGINLEEVICNVNEYKGDSIIRHKMLTSLKEAVAKCKDEKRTFDASIENE